MSATFSHVRGLDGSITTIARRIEAKSYRTIGVTITRELQSGTVTVDLNAEELRALVELAGNTAKRVRK